MTQPSLLMAIDVTDHDDVDTEPATVNAHGDDVDITFPGGRVMRFDRAELRAAIDDDHAQAA